MDPPLAIQAFVLPPDEIHVWWIDRLRERLEPADWENLLSAGERERMARYRFEPDRERYALRHGLLRWLLAGYTGKPPAELALTRDRSGKPILKGRELEFNLSSRQDWLTIGVSAVPVGVDIECVIPLPDLAAIVGRFFGPTERAELAALPIDRQTEAFFHLWTQKEAYLKAVGSGLDHPLQGPCGSADPDQPPRLREVDGSLARAARWSMAGVVPAPGVRMVVCWKAGTSKAVQWKRLQDLFPCGR
jgi:4'-phosphopantetheinyl transferase